VLTLFERLTFAQLPYYLQLMKHLAHRGIPVPDPACDASGDILHTLLGKPTAVVNRLRGKSELSPSPAHCAAVGGMLARMHLAGRDFRLEQPNLRSLAWWNETVPVVQRYLDAAYAALPRGAIHADLFRDNVMFDADTKAADGAEPRLTGFFDFYFAGVDTWLFDLAVCLNDWCVDLTTGIADVARTRSMLEAYSAQRPLTLPEHQLLPAMMRAGALRFWLSRLWDYHLPREASMLKAHDPTHFERILRQRIAALATPLTS
jgi:homoserine kinase type II